ncbi:hypothetical protein B1M_06980, partial [Burkholderia sp. TJI49]
SASTPAPLPPADEPAAADTTGATPAGPRDAQ